MSHAGKEHGDEGQPAYDVTSRVIMPASFFKKGASPLGSGTKWRRVSVKPIGFGTENGFDRRVIFVFSRKTLVFPLVLSPLLRGVTQRSRGSPQAEGRPTVVHIFVRVGATGR